MWETIIAAVLSALIGSFTSMAINVVNSRSHQKAMMEAMMAEYQRQGELQRYRLEQLEKKVDIHNHVVERTYELEKATAVLQNDIKVANHRIDDLEKTAK